MAKRASSSKAIIDTETENKLKRKRLCFNSKHAPEILTLQKKILELEDVVKAKDQEAEERIKTKNEELAKKSETYEALKGMIDILKKELIRAHEEGQTQQDLFESAKKELAEANEEIEDLNKQIARLPNELTKKFKSEALCFTNFHRGLGGMDRYDLITPELLAVSRLILDPSLPADLHELVRCSAFPFFAPMQLREVIASGCKTSDVALARIHGLLVDKRNKEGVNELFKSTFGYSIGEQPKTDAPQAPADKPKEEEIDGQGKGA